MRMSHQIIDSQYDSFCLPGALHKGVVSTVVVLRKNCCMRHCNVLVNRLRKYHTRTANYISISLRETEKSSQTLQASIGDCHRSTTPLKDAPYPAKFNLFRVSAGCSTESTSFDFRRPGDLCIDRFPTRHKRLGSLANIDFTLQIGAALMMHTSVDVAISGAVTAAAPAVHPPHVRSRALLFQSCKLPS